MDVMMSDQLRVVRNATRNFSERQLLPIAAEIDRDARFPWEVVDKMGLLGYFGIQAPPSMGGSGLDTAAYITIIEEISRVCAAIGLCVSVHNSVCLFPLLAFGTPGQVEQWAPPLARGEKIGAFCLTEPNAGSDAAGIEATAVIDGDDYIVNANKVFVTNGGVADICLVFVKTDVAAGPRGISVLVAERGMKGFVVGDLEDLSGMRANPVSSIRLYDCRIPRANLIGGEGRGLAVGLAALDAGRIGIAAQSVGIAQAALEASVAYARQRRQFGRPIASHQAIEAMIADMATRVDAARLMVQRAAGMRDCGAACTTEAAMAKLFASETATFVADGAVQIHGGYGYSKAYPVERYYRDARVTRIYEGTSEVHRMVIGRSVIQQGGA